MRLLRKILTSYVNVIVMGDLNARTAEHIDFIQDKNKVPVFEEYEDFCMMRPALERRAIGE